MLQVTPYYVTSKYATQLSSKPRPCAAHWSASPINTMDEVAGKASSDNLSVTAFKPGDI